MIKKILILFLFLTINVNLCLAEESRERGIQSLRKVAAKYNGNQKVVLKVGITLKPDVIVEDKGCAFISFKGDKPKYTKEYERMVVIPLNEIESINDQPVNQLAANFKLANFYFYEEEDLTKAIELYEKTLEIKFDIDVVIKNLCFAYNHTENFRRSITLGEKAIKIYPRDEEIWFNLSTAYLAIDDIENTLRCSEKVFAINSDSISAAAAHANLGNYYTIRDLSKAKTHFEKAKDTFAKNGNPERYKTIIKRISTDLKQLNNYIK